MESIIIILVFMILGIYFYKLYKSEIKKNQEKIKQFANTEKLLDYQELIHIAGHPYINANEKIILSINNKNFLCFYKIRNSELISYKEIEKLPISKIPINQITRYELKTESEIQKDVTLTRLLALGVLAYGLKKKTEINNTYLILSYVQNNVPIDCIFKNAVNNQQLGNIISTLNRLKIEQNSVQNNPNI